MRVLGQNDLFIKKKKSNHLLKLIFKLAYLMTRRRHVIKKYIFFIILVKTSIGNRDFIFELKP